MNKISKAIQATKAYNPPEAPTANALVTLRGNQTQDGFASMLNISKRALQYFESGERKVPDWLTLRLIRMGLWHE